MIDRAREDRGFGVPLTEEQRAARHNELYGSTDTPPRGTGLSGIDEGEVASVQIPWLAVGIGGAVGAIAAPGHNRILGVALGAGVGWFLSWVLNRS